ncbi:MAG: hypothetical protein IJL52_10110 [Clostridia bacterium]|nr:hypothetical protein [Clostridia bacterium]
MKKKRVIILCLAFCMVLIASAVLYAPLKARFYHGMRIEGTVTVTVNGTPVELKESSFSSDGNLHLVCSGQTATVSFRGGEYGDYAFDLVGLIEDRIITVHCFQHNWWNLLRFDLTLEIDQKANQIQYCGSVSSLSDRGYMRTEPIDKTQFITDESLQILLGL